MKKVLIVTALLAGAVSVYSQGEVSMNDYNGNFAIQIFTAQTLANSPILVSYGGYSGFEQQGNTDNGNVAAPGATSYNGTGLGAGYSVELLASPIVGASLTSLVPSSTPITSWYTGSTTTGLGGFWNSVQLASITGTTTTGTVALAAWDNEGGTITSLAAAQAAGDPWGVSDTANITGLGSGLQTPPNLPVGLTSFSMAVTPEPSTIALGVIGASAFLMRLRRKQ